MARKTTKTRKPKVDPKGATGRKTAGKKPAAPPPRPPHLSDRDLEFCLIYLKNMGNASAAYRETHPKANDLTCRVEGHRLLTKPNVAAFIEKERLERWRRHNMEGEEAFALISMEARTDPRLIYDAHGKIRPIHEWPDELALNVREIKHDEDGRVISVKFYSAQQSRRVIAEQTGKIKNSAVEAARSLARLLSGDYTEEEDARA